jgi:hypothetical protein
VGAGEPLVVQIVQGVGTVDTEFGTFPGAPVTLLASFSSSEDPLELEEVRTLEAAADCDVPDYQQGGGKDARAGDDQQDDGAGAGDDQQDDGTGAGKAPDNQQGGGGDTVTKTFELTLNGDVPADQLFTLLYTPVRDGGAAGGTEQVIFCGVPDPQPDEVVVSDEDCVGGGNTYT